MKYGGRIAVSQPYLPSTYLNTTLLGKYCLLVLIDGGFCFVQKLNSSLCSWLVSYFKMIQVGWEWEVSSLLTQTLVICGNILFYFIFNWARGMHTFLFGAFSEPFKSLSWLPWLPSRAFQGPGSLPPSQTACQLHNAILMSLCWLGVERSDGKFKSEPCFYSCFLL